MNSKSFLNMAKQTEISWCDSTFNFWEGCTKVSPGCTHCYAEARNNRFHGGENWGKGAPRLLRSDAYRKEPRKWEAISYRGRFRQCPECGWRGDVPSDEMDCPTAGCSCAGLDMFCVRPRVFSASLSDWLDDEVPIEWLADLLKLIHDTPNLDWLLLTKRPENWKDRVQKAALTWFEKADDSGNEMVMAWTILNKAPDNIWIGTTVEDQKRADERIPELLKIPARVRFLSCEPLLEAVEFSDVTNRSDCVEVVGRPALEGIDWVICGGESGHGARLFDVDWARSIRDQCQATGASFFLKQLGANVMGREMDKWVTRLKDKKGGTMSEWPQELQIREFPTPQAVHV